MWIIAGVLLGLMVLVGLAGFHTGPHTHVVAGALGALAALWLVVMAIDGRSAPVLWALLSADVVVSSGIAALAWKGLTAPGPALGSGHRSVSEGSEGIALTPLTPDGVVRIGGEDWSAVSRNGDVPTGGRVQVIRMGVRLEVWREDDVAPGELFSLKEHDHELDTALGRPRPGSSPSQPSEAPSSEPVDAESKEHSP
jgi:membrane protein implicated in regulation of membrane protease activity